MKQVDVCVIGSGPGGYVAAIKAAQLGKKVLVVEREKIGGVCLNCGCIPSKGLITAAHQFEGIKHLDEMGISTTGLSLDMSKLQTWKQGIVNKLTGGIGQLFKANGVEYLAGNAEFKSPTELEVKGSGVNEIIKATNFIVANGSRPIEIPGFSFDKVNVLSSTEALELDPVPKRLAVVGGGYIGLEIGSLFAKLGSEVTVIEAATSLLSGVVDPDCAQAVARSLKRSGVKVILGAKAQGFKKSGKELSVTISVDGKEQTVAADKILVTVGRKPNSDQLGLSKIGIKIDPKGFVIVNKQMRTNISNIFAIGDVAGQPMLAHKASHEGIVAAEVIAGKNAAFDAKFVPAVIFTDPEIAAVGLTVDEAKAKGFDVGVGLFPFAANGRALTMGGGDGFLKMVIDKKTELVLGVHIVGHEASQLISEAVLAIEMGATATDIAKTIHPHPTLPEMMMEAAEASLGHAIHIVAKPERKAGAPLASKTH